MSTNRLPVDYTFEMDDSMRQHKIKGAANVEVMTFINMLNSRTGLYSDMPDFAKRIGNLRFDDEVDTGSLSASLVDIADEYLREGFIKAVTIERDETLSEVYINIQVDIPGISNLVIGTVDNRIVPIKVVDEVYDV